MFNRYLIVGFLSACSYLSNAWGQPLALEVKAKADSDKKAAGDKGSSTGGYADFEKALTQAYASNPELKAALRAQYAQAEAIPQARAGWLPSITSEIAGTKQKTHTLGSQTNNVTFTKRPIDQKNSSFTRSGALSISQNLFGGGQTVHAQDQAESLVMAGEATLLNAEQNVLFKAIQAYLDLWLAQEVVNFRKASEDFFQTGVNQVNAQLAVGEKTIADVAEVESKLAGAKADRLKAESEWTSAKAKYLEVIGQEAPEKVAVPIDALKILNYPENLDAIKQLALDRNPGVVEAYFKEKAAQSAIGQAEGAVAPSLDLSASLNRDLTKDHDFSTDTRRNAGTAKLSLTIPLYKQGSEWSKIRQANQQRYQAKDQLNAAKRSAEQTAVSTWEKRKAADQSLPEFAVQVKSAAINLEGKTQEYLVGERTLTDMLEAQTQKVQAQVAYVQAQREYMVQSYSLLAVYGDLNPVALKLPISRIDAKDYTQSVRWKLFGVGNLR